MNKMCGYLSYVELCEDVVTYRLGDGWTGRTVLFKVVVEVGLNVGLQVRVENLRYLRTHTDRLSHVTSLQFEKKLQRLFNEIKYINTIRS